MDTQTRFNKHIKKDGTCWLWTAALSKSGYGMFKLNGKKVRAHRAAFVLARGPIPAGLMVLHTCDVRQCVNPDHLFVGTNADNMRDMATKGRAKAILSADKVKQVRQMHTNGYKQWVIAQSLGVSRQTISAIICGTRRKYVEGSHGGA